MKNIRKIIVLLLATCMLFVFTGCTYTVTINDERPITTVQPEVPTTMPEIQEPVIVEPTIPEEPSTEPIKPEPPKEEIITLKPEISQPKTEKMYAVGIPCVKDSPDILGNVVTFLKCGEEVKRIGQEGCYSKILYDGKELYVLSCCLSAKEPSLFTIIGMF